MYKLGEIHRELRYTFKHIDQCNMCDSPLEEHRVIGKRLNKSQGRNPKNKTGITTTVCKCNRCGLIFANPMPVPDRVEDHYGIPPEAYWKEADFVVREEEYTWRIDELRKLMQLEAGTKFLDIGAGLGQTMITHSRAGFDVYGFEPSKPFYENAIQRMGVNPEKLKLGTMEEVDYPENTFGYVSFGAVLEHLYDPSESILKALKWTKPGGIIFIEVPSSDWLINKIINFYYRMRRSDYVGNISPMHIPFHLYEFSIKSFREHARLHGYEVAHHDYSVCQTFMPKPLDFILKPYMKWTKTGMQLFVWLRKK